MFNRKVYSKLLLWKEQPNHKPLIIKGCRQCGKTYSVKQFAQGNYENVIYMDFHEQRELRALFTGSLQVEYLMTMISASIPSAVFIPHKTCIIFDEIQDCPGVRASLKFWKQDGQFDVICTGSLLGVSGYTIDDKTDYSIPVGSEQIMDMYPMDFEEWLWANGIQEKVITMLESHLHNHTPIPEILHQRMRTLFQQYVVVGGMPEAIKTFLVTHDMNQVITLQRSIVDEYKDDMVKYARNEDKTRIRECFESIPAQLSKEQKKFQYNVVRKGGRSKDYISSLQWIEDAGIIRKCYNTTITELPLGGNAIKDDFKVYMADTGLFVSMLDPGTQGDILRGDMNAYKGAIYENVMADILGKMGRPLFYFRKDSGLEIDFLIRYQDQCVPLECKATTGRAKSLRTVMEHTDKYHLQQAFKLGDYNVGWKDNILTLPMYMAFLIRE